MHIAQETALSQNRLPSPSKRGFSKFGTYTFLLTAVCLAIPIIDLPLLGLSLTAPLFFILAAEAIFRPPVPWDLVNRRYIVLAILIGTGIFLSLVVNGLSSGGVAVNSDGVITVIRFSYWLFIFILTIYLVIAGNLIRELCRVLGWSVLILVLLRWGETLVYGNIGAWTGTHLMTQNSYGFLYSVFSPFLLLLIFSEKKWERVPALLANVMLWGAAAINGSRGSWIAILVGVSVFLVVLLLSQPRKFIGALIFLVFAAVLSFMVFSSSSKISAAVETRLNTFQNLNGEKSFLIRRLMNQKALRLFEQSPLFGVGVARFRISTTPLDIPFALSYADQTHFDVKSSHNSYLGFLAENGLVGAVPFGILLLILVFGGLRAAVGFTKQNQYWSAAVYSSFAGMSAHMWAISALTNTANWFIYGLVAAMIILFQKEFQRQT